MIVRLIDHAGFWIGLIFAAGGGVFLAVVGQEQYRESRFESAGAVVAGRVLSKHIETELDKGRRYYYHLVAYRFKPAGGPTQTGEGKLAQHLYETLKPGDQINVLYVTDDPTMHRLESSTTLQASFSSYIVWFAGLFVLLGVFLLRVAFRDARRKTAD